jgi:hypothetical protein
MDSAFSTLVAKLSGHRRGYFVVGAFIVLALVVARAAYAGTPYAYYSGFANPGVPHSSAGWNNRDHNRACRDDATFHSYGLVRAADYNGSGTLVYDTGQLFTQCQDGVIARIEVSGYFLTRCWNSDTGGMILYCQTTTP